MSRCYALGVSDPSILPIRPLKRDEYDRLVPDRALLVVEVADESLRKDRLVKARLYANAGVPEYWIVNLPQRTLEIYRRPAPEGYGQITTSGPDQTVNPEAFPDIVVRVADLVPIS